jgi:hypothetical protein
MGRRPSLCSYVPGLENSFGIDNIHLLGTLLIGRSFNVFIFIYLYILFIYYGDCCYYYILLSLLMLR